MRRISARFRRIGPAVLAAVVLAAGGPASAQGPGPPPAQRPNEPAGAGPPARGAPAPLRLGLVADDLGQRAEGVRVVALVPGAPAEAAGVQTGDWIVGLNGRPIRTLEDLAAALQQTAGSEAVLELVRQGRRLTVPVAASPSTPTRSPAASARAGSGGQAAAAAGPHPPAGGPAPGRSDGYVGPPPRTPDGLAVLRPSLGASVAALDASVRRQLGVPVVDGALITGIEPGSPADRAGLPLGGVIVSADGRPVRTPEELRAVLAAAAPGQSVELGYYQGERRFHKTVVLAPAWAAPAGPPSSPPPAAPASASAAPSSAPPLAPDPAELERMGQAVQRMLERLTALEHQVWLLEQRVERLEAGRGRPPAAPARVPTP